MIGVNRLKILRDTIGKLIIRRNRTMLVKVLTKLRPEDIAYVLMYLRMSDRIYLFGVIPEGTIKSQVLKELPPEKTSELITAIGVDAATEYLKDIPLDDLTDILNTVDEATREGILTRVESEKASKLKGLLQYDEDSAGGIMNPEVFFVHESSTLQEVEEFVRYVKWEEPSFYIYVVDNDDKLRGMLSYRDIVINDPGTPLADVINVNVISVNVAMDQEEIARTFKRYNLLSTPVVDSENKLLGVITVDDIIDVMQAEATEDIMKLAGMGEELLVDLPSSKNFIKRAPWLFASWLGGILAGLLINVFNEFLTTQIALASFMPLILGMGGNVGNQSATIMVRGIALGKIQSDRIVKIILNQIVTGLFLGVFYGIILGLFAQYQYSDMMRLGFIVSLSLMAQLVIASMWGTLIPWVLYRLKFDPAVATAPLISSTMDCIGLLVYFGMAIMLL